MGRKRTGSFKAHADGRVELSIAGQYVGIFADETEAQKQAKAILNAQKGDHSLTFGAWGEPWFDRRELEARRRGRAEACAKERSKWRAHVINAPFYDLPLKKQQVQIFQKWIQQLAETEAMQAITYGRGENKRTELRPTGKLLSRSSIWTTLNLVQLCMDAAIREGKLPGLIVDGKIAAGNPARMVLLPPEDTQIDPEDDDTDLIVHLTEDEIRALARLEMPAFQRAVFTLAIYAGLRRGELWGLRWINLDLDSKTPHVKVRRSYNGPLKTKYSKRNPPLLAPAVAVLKAWRAAERAQGRACVGQALVFPNEDGRCFSGSYDAGWRDRPQKRGGQLQVTPGWRSLAGIRSECSFKELRHTCGCHLAMGTWLTQRLSLDEIKIWLGHSSISVTEKHYSAFTSKALSNTVAAVEYVGYMWDTQNGHTR